MGSGIFLINEEKIYLNNNTFIKKRKPYMIDI